MVSFQNLSVCVRCKIFVIIISLFTYNCFIVWSSVFLLSAASGIQIYTQAFAVYFLLEISPLLQSVVRINREKCTREIKEMLAQPERNEHYVWLSSTFLAVNYFILYLVVLSVFLSIKVTGEMNWGGHHI